MDEKTDISGHPAQPLPLRTDEPISLIGLDRAELAQELARLGEKPFRAKQLWRWIYVRGATTFEEMTDISRSLREKLIRHYTLARPEIVSEQLSEDGTRKWLLRFADGNEVETVFIPEEGRGALCVSSQVGCTLTCKFCHTGTQRLVRNLTAREIVQQLMVARDTYEDWETDEDGRAISNVVLMGMGEPLYNYDNVAKALGIMTHQEGLAVSRRKVTLSTAGVVPEIERLGREVGVNLAISLHAPNDELRAQIMPINKKYPLEKLMAALRNYPISSYRRITLEYVMLKDLNDSVAHAKELVDLVRGVPCKFNLIPFNPWEGAPYGTSTPEAVDRFANVLYRAGFTVTVRRPRGRDIMAACGQLKSASEKKKKAEQWAEAIQPPR